MAGCAVVAFNGVRRGLNTLLAPMRTSVYPLCINRNASTSIDYTNKSQVADLVNAGHTFPSYMNPSRFTSIDGYRKLRKFPRHLPIEFFEEFGSRKLDKSFIKYLEQLEKEEIASFVPAHRWKIAVATTVERYQRITDDVTEEELKHLEFRERMDIDKSAVFQMEIDHDQRLEEEERRMKEGGDDRRLAAEIAAEAFQPASRLTSADQSNDRQSLDRKLSEKLFLVVKSDKGWRMPEVMLGQGESLREGAERAAQSVVSESTELHFVGNAPCYVETVTLAEDHPESKEFAGIKTFYMRSALTLGTAKVELNDDRFSDYLWLSRDELKAQDSEFYEVALDDGQFLF